MSEINALNQTAQSDTEFVLTDENYYSAEANQLYLSNSMFKAVYGHPANPNPCAAAAFYGPRVETEALIIGSYVDAYFEGPDAFEKFKEENAAKLTMKSGKGYYKFVTDADAAIIRASRDAVFMDYMSGNHQTIMTGTIAGHKFKIKMDSYHPGKMIVDLKYVKSAGSEYNEHLKKYSNFIENYGYAIQGAIYQEIVFQNTGLRLPFYIAYITKESVTDFGVVEIPQDMLDEALDFVKLSLTAQPFAAIKANPNKCNRRSCPYCKDQKVLSNAMSYEDFKLYSAS